MLLNKKLAITDIVIAIRIVLDTTDCLQKSHHPISYWSEKNTYNCLKITTITDSIKNTLKTQVRIQKKFQTSNIEPLTKRGKS